MDGRAGDFQRFGLGGDRRPKLGVHRFQIRQSFLGRLQPRIDVGQPPFDRLLQHAVGVFGFVQFAPDGVQIAVQLLYFDTALIGLDQFARRLLLRLLEGDLDFAQLDGEVRANLVLVGLDLGERHGHGGFEPARGELDGAVPQWGRKHEAEQASQEEAQRPEHEPLDHQGL
ncbi:hypothetical protein [Methyloceanibacter methanicus]|uniref:hypothetical protein n=1 Tax=Methyloceanibacter methanicus TaxID=1774968 RepID=UPI00114CBD4E|nr:hypothetical protein [Methyloceanibacter methanicus]